jgi:alkaline phosphatase D
MARLTSTRRSRAGFSPPSDAFQGGLKPALLRSSELRATRSTFPCAVPRGSVFKARLAKPLRLRGGENPTMNFPSLVVVAFSLLFFSSASAEVFTAQGVMSGEPTSTSILLQTRLTAIPGPAMNAQNDVPGAAGVACFEYGLKPNLSDGRRTAWFDATANHDFIVRAQLTNLQPGQLYYYRPVFGATQSDAKPGRIAQFATLPGKDLDSPITFIVGSCMNYMKFMFGAKGKAGPVVTATTEDKQLGFRSFVAMAKLKPDFFVGTGDIVYYDNILHGPATKLPELRACWHEQFRFPRLIEFFARTPSYWSKDDHDFRFNESDNETSKLPLPQTGIELFREQMPILPAGDRSSPTYRTHRVNRHLQIWLTEGRDHRSPNEMPDGPNKSLWGAEQRAWLQRTLRESDATWKILISPTPMVGPDDATKIDNHADIGGFRHEADAFFAWLKDNRIGGFMTFCGDRHWQYHSIHPSGVEEFACGALNDENARLGVPPGSKKGTDPEARIKQPYLYTEPTGGFIRVEVSNEGGNGARLIIEHRDDNGRVMNSVIKSAPARR